MADSEVVKIEDVGISTCAISQTVSATATSTGSERNVYEPHLYQSVLMDHEYECYTVWDELLEDMSAQDLMDSFNAFGAIENEVEIQDGPYDETVQLNNGVAIDHQTNLNIPPSPATATLQEILQSAYNQSQDIQVSYDHPLNQRRFNAQTQELRLGAFDETPHTRSVTPGMGSSVQDALKVVPTAVILANTTKHVMEGSSGVDDENPYRSDTNAVAPVLIENDNDRLERFTSGLKYISTKITKMRLRTGAVTIGSAQYNGEVYRYEPSLEAFQLLVTDANLAVLGLGNSDEIQVRDFSYSFNDRDDHRYAAQYVERTSSWPATSNHQSEFVQSKSLGTEIGTTACRPSYEKRTYERNKSFLGHLQLLFREAVKRLELQTGAFISLTVYYQDHVFTKANYEGASTRLTKKKGVQNCNATSPLQPATSSTNYSVSGGFKPTPVISSDARMLHQQSISAQQESATSRNFTSRDQLKRPRQYVDDFESIIYSGRIPVSQSNTSPVCDKCYLSRPRTSFGDSSDTNGFVAWVRCSDPLCNYLVHAACLGFRIQTKNELRALPPFCCEYHRD